MLLNLYCPVQNINSCLIFFFFCNYERFGSPQNASGSNDLAESSLYTPGMALSLAASVMYEPFWTPSTLMNRIMHINNDVASVRRVYFNLPSMGLTCLRNWKRKNINYSICINFLNFDRKRASSFSDNQIRKARNLLQGTITTTTGFNHKLVMIGFIDSFSPFNSV